MNTKAMLLIALVSMLMIGAAHAASNLTNSTNANATQPNNSSVPRSPLIGIFRTNQTYSPTTSATTSIPSTTTAVPAASAAASNATGSSYPVLVTVSVAIAAAVAYSFYGGRRRKPDR